MWKSEKHEISSHISLYASVAEAPWSEKILLRSNGKGRIQPLKKISLKLKKLRKSRTAWNWEVFGDLNRKEDDLLENTGRTREELELGWNFDSSTCSVSTSQNLIIFHGWKKQWLKIRLESAGLKKEIETLPFSTHLSKPEEFKTNCNCKGMMGHLQRTERKLVKLQLCIMTSSSITTMPPPYGQYELDYSPSDYGHECVG